MKRGTRLADAFPEQLSATRRHAIAAVAARAAVEHMPEWLGCVVDLGKTYRAAGDAESAAAVFRQYLSDAANKIDYAQIIRGYWYEWGVCEGQTAAEPTANAWLSGISLSDHLNPAPITPDDIKLICAGLGVAFGKLAGRDGQGTYARARRAVAWLGERTNPDTKAQGYFKNNHRAADEINTPWPTNRQQAIDWLREGVRAAGLALRDPMLKGLADPATVGFEHLDVALGSGRA